MNYPKLYLEQIRTGNIVACEKIKLTYEREVSYMDNPPDDFPYYFDEEVGNKHIQFMELFCKHSKGKWAGKDIRFELFQKAKLQLVFGWLEKETGLRRFREVDDIRARKNGKSTETSSVEWDMLLNDKEPGAEIYCTANKLDQAKIVFNECVNMRTQSKELKAVSRKRQSDIYVPYSMSFIKALASDSKTLDGLNTHFFSLDEFHEQRNRKLYDVMIQSLSAREQPLAWLISTNGDKRGLFFDIIYDYASKVALNQIVDYRLLPIIYELDDRDEWKDPKAWIKANPGLGTIKKISAIAELVEKAKIDSSVLPTLLTKDFNIPENTHSAWLSYQDAHNDSVADMEFLRNSYAIGGCDLSATTDLTCATVIIRKPNDSNFYVLQKYFLPEKRVKEVADKEQGEAPYKTWSKAGWLHECEGATVDYHAVTEWFVNLVNEYNIRPLWLGYDAALSGYWREEMDSYGFDMEKIRQGAFTWSYPFKQLKGLFQEHRVIYQNNPMLLWCLLNTGVKSTNRNGIDSQMPVKEMQERRIDGLVSLLNAFVCYYNHEEEYLNYVK